MNSVPSDATDRADPPGQVSREALYDEVWRHPMLRVAERYGVSSSFMARVCTSMNVPRPPRGHWAKLEADLAKALMSINAVRGVEIGDGFAVVEQKGSAHRDAMSPRGFASNHAGGILGGISTGQDILASIALKPTSSIRLDGETIDKDGESTSIVTLGRHDPCVGIRAVPIAEAMVALVLIDHLLRQRGQNADVEVRTPVITRDSSS